MVVLEELTSAELELLLERGAKTAVIPLAQWSIRDATCLWGLTRC